MEKIIDMEQVIQKMHEEDYYDPMAQFDLVEDDVKKEYFLEINSHLNLLYASLDVYMEGKTPYNDCIKLDIDLYKDRLAEEGLRHFKRILDMRYNIYTLEQQRKQNVQDNPLDEAERSASLAIQFTYDIAFALNSGEVAEYAEQHGKKLRELIKEEKAKLEDIKDEN